MHQIFVILTRGRTGSTTICSDINQHSEVVCHEELFRTTPIESPYDLVPSYEAVKMQKQNLSAEEYLMGIANESSKRVLGFKSLLGDLDRHESIGLEQFLLKQAKIVFLTRDPVRAALSAGIAKTRGAFNRHTSLEDRDYLRKLASRVILDPGFIIDEIRYNVHWVDVWKDRLNKSETPHIFISYEEYIQDRRQLLNKIFRFLGVMEVSEVKPAEFLKVTSENIWDDIINAGEIKEALASFAAKDAPFSLMPT